jgi:RHS repeat-associated protein
MRGTKSRRLVEQLVEFRRIVPSLAGGLSRRPQFSKTLVCLRMALGLLALAVCASHDGASAGSAPAMITPGQYSVSPSGAFTYSVPIAVPPGTSGMVPALSLEYSTQSGDGLLGLGWTLSGLPSISRCARTLAQDSIHGSVNYDPNDRFCLDGQRLVLITPGGTYGGDGTEYRTEIEGFSRIIAHGTVSSPGVGPKYFEVHTKSGQIMYFGYNDDTDNPSNNSGQILSTLIPTVRAWAVEKIADTKGNFLTVKYTIDTQVIGTDTRNIETRPAEIDYTGNDAKSLAPYAKVKFVYESRNNVLTNYQAGYLTQTAYLLENIQTFIGSTMITNYGLGYTFAAANTAQRDELSSITQCDNSSPTPKCLLPETFGWQGTKDAVAYTAGPDVSGVSDGSDLGAVVVSGDFNADGLTDALPHTQGGVGCDIYTRSFGGTSFVAGGFSATFPYWYQDPDGGSPIHLHGNLCFADADDNPNLASLDFDGDGYTDLTFYMSNAVPAARYFLQNNQSKALNDTNHYLSTNYLVWNLGDFDGDGRTDFFGGGTSSYFFISQGDGNFIPGTVQTGLGGALATHIPSDFDGDGCDDLMVQGTSFTPIIRYSCNPAVTTASIPNWLANQFVVVLGDFNGDGKTDVLRTEGNQSAELFLSNGKGINSTATWTGVAGDNFYKYSIYTGDFNGDGKTDLLLIADGISTPFGNHFGVDTPNQIWLSTGNGFVLAATIPNSGNPIDDGDGGLLAKIRPQIDDWNSDSASDIWLLKPSGDLTYDIAYTPEVIKTVSNGLGVTTTVTYDRINNPAIYTKANDATYPTRDIDAPIYVVSRIDSANGLGACVPPSTTNCYSSTYTYGGAKLDLKGRGFLGFGTVKITDLQTGIVQTTTYSTTFPTIGLAIQQTKVCPHSVCTSGAVTLNTTNNTYEDVGLGSGTDGVARHFVTLTQSVAASNDLDGTAMPTTTTTDTYDCDTMSGGASICAGTSPTGFGNATAITVSVSDGSSKTTTNTYANDATNWYLGRLITANVQSIVVGFPTLTRQTSYCYDLSYAPVGTSCATSTTPSGLLTQEIVEPEASADATLKLETDYTYDAYGNKASSTTKGCVWLSSTNCSTTAGLATRETDTLFDDATYHGQFATKVTNTINQHETWAFTDDVTKNNTGFGVPSNHTGPNGLITSWQYDTFGRKVLETRPDGNKTAIVYAYCTGLPTGESCPATAQFDVVTTPENSAGAQNGPITIAYYDGLSRQIVMDTEGFDAPGSSCASSACWIRVATQYDAEGHIGQTSRPYFLSGGTAKWTVNSYDTIGRVYSTTFPDSSIVNYGFHSLTTTVVNDKGQVTTTVKNAQGLVASVENDSGRTTTYVYDAFGDLTTVTDSQSNVTAFQYDIRGRKTLSSDPDMGVWTYVYDGFGELYSQVDAKSKRTALHYDKLGRVAERDETDLTSNWTYDTATGAGVGQLASATTDGGYVRTPVYDSLGRPSTTTLTVDGTANTYAVGYDANGRVQTVAYPSGFTVKYTYTSLGYLYQASDNGGSHQVFWTANTRDAELHLLTETAGNTVATTQSFDANTGRLLSILAGATNNVASQHYSYDTLGNLTSRSWLRTAGVSPTTENACYDNLNRLTSTQVTTGTTCTGTGAVLVAYNPLGNISKKSDICNTANCFVYGSGAGPHALTSIVGSYNGVSSPTFSYDANGNMVSGGGRTVTSTSFNMASLITDGTNSAALTYDSEHARIKQVATGANAGTTAYLNDPSSGAMEEKFIAGSVITWRDYIIADGKMVGQRSCVGAAPCTGTPTLEYFTFDHLGSISVITDGTGAVLERLSYDAWGMRRNPDGTASGCGTLSSSTTRGFTGQEMMDGVCLINFNARVYDPSLGRFMSPDSVTQSFYDMQMLNRYSYVGNNPLTLTDPTGNCAGFVGCFAAYATFGILQHAEGQLFKRFPFLGAILEIVATYYGSPLAGAGVAAGISGAEGGHGADVFKAFILTYSESALYQDIGNANISVPEQALAAGFVGGTISAANGGKFGPGFLAAGVSTLVGPYVQGVADGNRGLGTALSATVGGVTSVLGGGKFANGAITSAFAYVASSINEDADTASGRSSTGSAAEVESQRRGGGCCYITQSLAAAVALGDASGLANFFYHEFGGAIYSVKIPLPDGLTITEYGYTVFEGGANGIDYRDTTTTVSWWHTHPPGGSDSSNMFLSDARTGAPCGAACDIQQTMGLDKTHGTVGAFLFTPNSEFRYFPDPVSSPHSFSDSYYFGKGFSGD